jgi:hypothetical protein
VISMRRWSTEMVSGIGSISNHEIPIQIWRSF